MSKLLVLLLLGSLVSCATGRGGPKGKINDLEDDFSWLDNKDFQKVFEVKYQEPKDTYPKEISAEDVLASESVARLSEGRLDDVTGSDDVISKVVGNCYKGDFNDAQDLIRKSRRKYKKNPSFWNQVGTCYFLQKERRKALIFYNKALALKKNFVPAINNLGVLHQSEGNDQRALAAYEEASKLSSFSLTPSFNKAQLYLKYGFINKAESVFSTLWRKNKRDRDVVHALAVIYLVQGKFEKSVSAYQALNYDTQEIPGVALNYALVLAFSGQKDKAAVVLKGLEDKDLNNYLSYYKKVQRIVGSK